MKFLVVSDSHGNVQSLDLLAKKYPKMDLYLHLGDSECDEFQILPFISVKGNCDYFSNFQESLIIPTPMGNLLAMHHPYPSTKDMKTNSVKFFLHGHTHRRRNEVIGDIVYLNPGSISYPRDSHPNSYMIMTIEDSQYQVEFLSL